MAASLPSRATSARRWRRWSSAFALVAAIDAPAFAQRGAAPARDDVARRARLLRIEDTRRDEPAFLDSLLSGADPRLRAAAALAAGRIGARSHAATLRTLAGDPDTAVAANAVFALALLRDSAAVHVAARALRAPHPVAVEAASLLGALGERGRAPLVAGLRDNTLRAAVQGALLLSAARLRPVPADVVIPFLAAPDTALTWRAAYALARGRSAAGVRWLIEARASGSSAVREQVARGLSRAIAGDSLGDQAFRALAGLVRDPEPRVRVNAVRALASHGPAARAYLEPALGDTDAGVRLAAAQSIAPLMDSSASAWMHVFAADTAFVVRQTVASAAARRGILLPVVARWRTSRDWRERAAAVDVDAAGSADTVLARMRPWLAQGDGRVRAAAAGVVAGLLDSAGAAPPARAALRGMLRDPDVWVRATALGGLARDAGTDDLAAAVVAHAAARDDGDADARLAFWQLADSALRRANGALPDSVARALDHLARPADPLERIAASRIPRFARWADSTGTARPLSWYEVRAREARSRPPVLRILTDRGTLELELFAADAPLTVFNIVSLARRGYFDGQRFHRVVPNFVVQGGDPRGDGNGGPGYAIRDELNRRRYLRGTLGMALSGPDTGGSQFFVTHSPQPHLDGGYTVFGRLRRGADVLDRIVQGDRIVRITVR